MIQTAEVQAIKDKAHESRLAYEGEAVLYKTTANPLSTL
jgi:hypothetical protein